MAEAVILLFNIDTERAAKIRMLGAMLKIKTVMVPMERYNHSIGELADGNPDSGTEPDTETIFSDPMMVMCNLSPAQFNRFLDDYKKFRLKPIPLKAILTATNAGWTPVRLRDELAAERSAIARGFNAHKQ